jgi:sulfide:quinone oxidoreductase
MPAGKVSHVVIVGGGTAGITVASALSRRAPGNSFEISIIEPADVHYYQPAFTLVGAGKYRLSRTRRPEQKLIPRNVEWIRDRVAEFHPDNNGVRLASGPTVSYDFLVVCPGLSPDWEKIQGARESLGRSGVCSNYVPDYVEDTWNTLQGLQPGATALFTQPPLPFKCPGAPQKIAYLAADYLKRKGILGQCRLHFLTHAPAMFAVPLFARELAKVAQRYGIVVHFQHNLVAVDWNRRSAVFEAAGADGAVKRIEMQFDMLHMTPPQSPPEVVRKSPLANQAGWVDVHQHSLQHVRYPNVFGLGDAASTPNSKTAAAIRKQAPVVVRNLLALAGGGKLDEGYDGYASCPLTTAYGKAIMAEFIYGGKVTPTFPLDPRRERRINWWIKTTGLPMFYWYYMLKGYDRFLPHNTSWVEPAR